MSKKPRISKNDVVVALSILLVIASVMVLAFPKSPVAVTRLLAMRRQMIANYAKVDSARDGIRTEKEQTPSLEAQRTEKLQQKELLREKLGGFDLQPHMPSLLILLEQNAEHFGLKLTIFYDLIDSPDTNAQSAQPVQPAQPAQPGSSDATLQEGQGGQTSTGQANKPTEASPDKPTEAPPAANPPSTTGEGNGSEQPLAVDLPAVMASLAPPQNSLLNVTMIPIRVAGSFTATRDYLNFLDQVDCIEPNYIQIISDGQQVEAWVVLYIYTLKGV